MSRSEYPVEQGLYSPEFEHEACGIGMIANINGKKTHNIVHNAITMLCNLEHRGGQSADTSTGDGAGILTQIPDRFFQKQCMKEGFSLPQEGDYAVAMIFLPNDLDKRMECKSIIESIVEEEGQTFLGWRPVPLNDSFIGRVASESKPTIRQGFIGKSKDLNDPLSFERKLFIIRKRIENVINQHSTYHDTYICSLSSRTIVYKGMLIPEQLGSFYIDLNHPEFKSALALVHSRFSTNTFPSWKRAHPNRYTIHNGEFNTIRGNVNWMHAREKLCRSDFFDEKELEKILPVNDADGSDSSIFDNTFEFLHLSGFSLAHTAMMMIPEPWSNNPNLSDERRDFYEYHSTLMEPWDGPSALVYTDGVQIGACLDRNGLRPARYYVTKSGMIVLGSEVGALDIFADDILFKSRLEPGKMLLVDIGKGIIIPDETIKMQIATQKPYKEWLMELKDIHDIPDSPNQSPSFQGEKLLKQQIAFGYSQEELDKILIPLVTERKDPIGSMGYDAPLAVLSQKPRLLFDYFKQLFAQVTNPPIDAIREKIVTMATTSIGPKGNLVSAGPESCKRIRLHTPILTNRELEKLRKNRVHGYRSATISILFGLNTGLDLEQVLQEIFAQADKHIREGVTFLILSDRGVSKTKGAIPSLLAVSGLHHYLMRQGVRTKVSILLESGEPREVHHFATLLGYGAEGINPYLAIDTFDSLAEKGQLGALTVEQAITNYIHTVTDGIVKVISKMGISTIQSYQGAQIFEAVGISNKVIGSYFTGTASRIGGIGLDIIQQEVIMRHQRAFKEYRDSDLSLEVGDDFQYRSNGEDHQYNPKTIYMLQHAVRSGDYQLFKTYTKLITDEKENLQSLRGLLKFKKRNPIPIDEVESVESICRRFKTGAMSFGAISKEAHESLAIAMNRIGGKSNSGEGGESAVRYQPDSNGDLRRSAVKQVASGRFGVTSHYLVNAEEIQIKVAQGAKPGEGGHLPGNKVYPWVAEVRGSTPGVELISPPPHHDIYSIEDLAELIFNLKNANPNARISVKLVSAVGVGTIAAGVVKGRADHVLISGYDGGTGAAPYTSLKHAGLPWEIGLAETHQTLLLNGLRDRVAIEADGKMMTGRDVVIAALLGAEEFGFSTAPLVALGCVMMRVCHLDTCPVGIATQNPALRKRFAGKPEHVVNFMRFIARQTREIMAELGFRTINEMVGRTDVLEPNQKINHWKAKNIDLSALLYQPVNGKRAKYQQTKQNHGIEKTLDFQEIIPSCTKALEGLGSVSFTTAIRNIHRSTGTLLGSLVTEKFGEKGLPDDYIQLTFSGSAGQSFGAYVPRGITLRLIGDANDFVGKGLSGGKVIVQPDPIVTFQPEKNVIIGNVAFYGATSGEAFIRGIAGERFCVRNSGANVVVEGVGDHACEYMTGGRVVVLGPTGKNFAAGMSGGVAYVLDVDGSFLDKVNHEMVHAQGLQDLSEVDELYELLEKHVRYTNSIYAERILTYWENTVSKFVRVIPRNYATIQGRLKELLGNGVNKDEAEMQAFQEMHQGLLKKKEREKQGVKIDL